MDCTETRTHLHDLRRRRLDGPTGDAVVHHLDQCRACRGEDEAEALLDRLLTERLPRRAVPPALQARLLALAAEAGPATAPEAEAEGEEALAPAAPAGTAPLRIRTAVPLAAGLAAALLLGGGAALLAVRGSGSGPGPAAALAAEALNDHLRLLASGHPLDVASSVNHEVKPWFAGRVDFAPAVPAGGGEVELLGGALGYFLDRKAAVVSYGLRRHRLTLVVFPADGLAWPAPTRPAGGAPATAVELRGFHVLLWRQGGLGYALVSDASAGEFDAAAEVLARATAAPAGP